MQNIAVLITPYLPRGWWCVVATIIVNQNIALATVVRSGGRQKHVVGSELEFERIQLELDSQGHSKVRVDLPAKSSSKSNNMHQRRQIRKEQPEIHKDKPINGSLPELHSQNASLIHNEERDIDKDKPINRSLSALHSQRFLIHNESSRKPAACIVKLYGTKNCESTLRQTINHSAPTRYMLSGAEKKKYNQHG